MTPRPTVVVLMGTIKLSVQWRGEFIAVRKNDSNENIDQEGAKTLLGRHNTEIYGMPPRKQIEDENGKCWMVERGWNFVKC